MFPVTVDDLMVISDAGGIMPPKSTWFEPKLRDGLLSFIYDRAYRAAEAPELMKVLVADKFEKSGLEGLKAAGCEVVYEPELKDDALTEAIRATGADVLVVRSTKVTDADARRRAAVADRPRRRGLQHDRRRRRLEARHLRVELPGQERRSRSPSSPSR